MKKIKERGIIMSGDNPKLILDGRKTGHPVAAEILMMEEYTARARVAWTDNKGDGAALQMVRKVAALAVRCMENHGAPLRQCLDKVCLLF